MDSPIRELDWGLDRANIALGNEAGWRLFCSLNPGSLETWVQFQPVNHSAKRDVPMKKILHWIPRLFVGAIASALATGCLGPQVLKERTEHVPAPDPKVELRLKSEKPADILVFYDDLERQTGKVTRRAFYLFANEKRLENGKRPVLLEPGRVGEHVAIPVFKEPPADPKAVSGDIYAISSSPWVFRIESRGRLVAEFELPMYGNWLTAKKFFLFPLAAAADAVGVGAAVGAAAAVGTVEGMAKSGGSITVH